MVYRTDARPTGEALRELLVQEALRDLEDGGVESLNVTKLCLRIGVSNAASYAHFPGGFVEVLAAVAARGFDALRETLERPPIRTNAEARIHDVFVRYVRFGMEHPHLYRAMYSARFAIALAELDVSDGKTARTFHELMLAKNMAYGPIATAVQASSDGMRVRPSRRKDAAKTVASLAHGVVLEFIEEGIDLGTTTAASRSKQRLKMASRVVQILLHGALEK